MTSPHGSKPRDSCEVRKSVEQLLDVHFCDSGAPMAEELGAFARHQAGILARLELQVKQLQTAQRQSEEAARDFVHSYDELALLVEPHGTIVAISARATEKLSGSTEDLVGKCIYDLFPPRTAKAIGKRVEEVLCSGKLSWIRDEQSESYLEGAVCPVFGATGGAERLAIYIRDTSRQKEMLLALSESEARFFRLIQSLPDGVAVANTEGQIEYVNPTWQPIVVVENADTNISDVIAPDHRRHFQAAFRRAIERLQAEEIKAPDVAGQWWRWAIVPLALHGRVEAVAVVAHDMAAQRQAEGDILAASELAEQRIGQDLHDGLGQSLMGLGYLAETLRRRLQRRQITESGLAEELVGGIESALDSLRGLAKGLVGMECYPQGLPYALKELAANIDQHSGISCRFEGKPNVTVGEPESATHLFRIAQEATNNAAKHSKAHSIEIGLKETGESLVLRISDNGVGMPGRVKEADGLGLRNMRHRARVLGATLEVMSTPSSGTVIECSLSRSGRRGGEGNDAI